MNNTILEIKNLSKNYHTLNSETKAIDNLSFTIKKNEILAIVGPSGCGKSTLLSILANIEKKSSGEIIKQKDFEIGYMLQSDTLFPWLTIMDNVLIGLKIKRKNNKKNINNAINLLKKYGLYDFRNSYPNNLSGGMRQRVALIRTLAINPQVILLDEPYSALDYQTRKILANDMYKIIKNEQKTAVLITHNIEEAVNMADRVIVLTKRPCRIKNIYEINLKDKSYQYYYDLIWRDLDVNI